MVKTAFDHNLTTTQNATLLFANTVGRIAPADFLYIDLLRRELDDLLFVLVLFAFQQLSYRVCDVLLQGVGHVHIGVHREAHIGMSEHMRDRFNVHALLDRQGSEAVSEIMEANLRYSCSALNSMQPVCDCLRIVVGSRYKGRKHQLCSDGLFCFQFFEQFH